MDENDYNRVWLCNRGFESAKQWVLKNIDNIYVQEAIEFFNYDADKLTEEQAQEVVDYTKCHEVGSYWE